MSYFVCLGLGFILIEMTLVQKFILFLGQPVYALRQTNGTAHLYFGAYESAQQAALAVPTVREAGLTPTLVYRIGRVF